MKYQAAAQLYWIYYKHLSSEKQKHINSSLQLEQSAQSPDFISNLFSVTYKSMPSIRETKLHHAKTFAEYIKLLLQENRTTLLHYLYHSIAKFERIHELHKGWWQQPVIFQ